MDFIVLAGESSYAGAFELAGWAGPVILATTSIAATFALLAFILGRQIPSTYAVVAAFAAFILSTSHFLARPHVLALAVMLAWASGLISASERREAPSFWLLPLIALWTNLHGSFVFGMVFVAALAIDAGLLHMALSHVRNIEIFALLIPLVVLAPLALQFGLQGDRRVRTTFPVAAAALLAVIVGVSTWSYAASHEFLPVADQSPAAAVDALKQRNPRRVLNELSFGGYLISRGLPVFIDGRAELYGEQFEMTYLRALQLKDVNLFLDLLKDYDIDAVLLTPTTPAATLLDHLGGWQRVYADENAVVHVRTANGTLSTGMVR